VASGRKTGSILAPPSEEPSVWVARATASNLDTLLDRGVDRVVRMLLSFQRPSHLFGRGLLRLGRIRMTCFGPRRRTDEYSAGGAWLEDFIPAPMTSIGKPGPEV